MTAESYWAAAQTVSRMEHLVRRDIERIDHGAFIATFARHWKVDGRQFSKEYPLIGGYVFFMTQADDWAGIPDVNGVFRVLSNPDGSAKRITEKEMARLMVAHIGGHGDLIEPPKYTKYYRPQPGDRKRSRKPRPGKRLRNFPRG